MKRLIAMVLLICLLLSGCAGAEGYVPTGNGLTPEEGENPTSPTEAEEVLLKMPYYASETMNPYTSTNFTNRSLFPLLYEGLFTVSRDYEATGRLCKELTASADNRTFTLTLAAARFSDGTQVTARDVVASLNAAKEGTYYAGRFTYIKSVAAGEDGSVVITASCAMENLPLLLDIPIVKEMDVQADRPIGSGPYAWGEGQLVRRADWWLDGNLPIHAQTIDLVASADATQIRDDFQFSDMNLVLADPCSDRYADYMCDFELWDAENGNFVYLGFNITEEKFFANEAIRQLITYAVDRDTIASGAYQGFARSACLPCSPLFPYYSTVLAEKYSYDIQKLSDYVQANNLAGTPIVMLANSDDSLRLRVARSIAASLESTGLVVTLSTLNSKKYAQALSAGEYDLYVGQTRLSPNMDLSVFFKNGGKLSYGGISDVTPATLCQEALANHGNYYTLHKYVMDNALICPVVFQSYAIYADRGLLTGLNPARDNLFYFN